MSLTRSPLLAAVGEAEEDIAAGRLVANEQMKARIGQWSQREQCDIDV